MIEACEFFFASKREGKAASTEPPAGRQNTDHIGIIVVTVFGAGFSRPGILAGPKTHYGRIARAGPDRWPQAAAVHGTLLGSSGSAASATASSFRVLSRRLPAPAFAGATLGACRARPGIRVLVGLATVNLT